MNLGNFMVFTLFAIPVSFFIVHDLMAKKNSQNLLHTSGSSLLVILSATLGALMFGTIVSFGCFGNSECSDVQRFTPIWLTPVVFSLVCIPSAKSIYKQAGGSIIRILKELVLPVALIILLSCIVGAVAGVLTV